MAWGSSPLAGTVARTSAATWRSMCGATSTWRTRCFSSSTRRAAVGALVDHARAGDVGRHQVDGELHAVEGQVERLGERAHDERLADARHALDQHVAAGEERGQDDVDGVLVAHHHPADLVPHGGEGLLEVADRGLGEGGGHGGASLPWWANTARTAAS